MSSEEIAQRAADAVRDVVAEAERRAEEIVREAEADARRVRSEAEADAERIRAEARAETPDLGANGSGGDAAVRLEAMRLALAGKGGDEIAAELEGRFGPGDRAAVIEDVLGRARGRPAAL